MSYYYEVYIAFSDKKLLKTIVKTNNLGKSIEALINSRPNTKAIMLKARELTEEEAKKKGSNNNE